MIRDPSDGSVREKPVAGIPTTETTGVIPAIQTGLPPEPKKPKDIAKLERSREWLQNYKSQKGQ